MTDYFHIVPSINLNKTTSLSPADSHDDVRTSALKKKHSTTSPGSAHTLSRLVRGANNFLASRKDVKAELEREEARKLDERKQILGLRMKNVSLSSLRCYAAVRAALSRSLATSHRP